MKPAEWIVYLVLWFVGKIICLYMETVFIYMLSCQALLYPCKYNSAESAMYLERKLCIFHV